MRELAEWRPTSLGHSLAKEGELSQGTWTPRGPEAECGCGPGGGRSSGCPNLSSRGHQGVSFRNTTSHFLRIHSPTPPTGLFLQLLETETRSCMPTVDCNWSVTVYDCGCEQITVYESPSTPCPLHK